MDNSSVHWQNGEAQSLVCWEVQIPMGLAYWQWTNSSILLMLLLWSASARFCSNSSCRHSTTGKLQWYWFREDSSLWKNVCLELMGCKAWVFFLSTFLLFLVQLMSKTGMEPWTYVINSALLSNLDRQTGTLTLSSSKAECFMQKTASEPAEAFAC